MLENILEINKRLKQLAFDKQIVFCDVHKAMVDSNGDILEELADFDGIHFTLEGKKVCGDNIGKSILELLEIKKN
jgi:lysophospholipase L1-like esterase